MRRTDSRTDDHMLKLQWVEALGIGCRVWAVLEDRDRGIFLPASARRKLLRM
jgi:hypothetical protein